MKVDYSRDGKELQAKARTQGFPMVSLYQHLAFPIKEKGKGFHRKVLFDMPAMHKHA
jgi:hypothetical protein